MRRRDFITMLGGAAVAWPLTAHAQPADRMRRIGALMSWSADDPEAPTIVGAFLQGLQELGWILGRNVRIDYRWAAADDDDHVRRYAAELVALAPDVILAGGGAAVRAVQRASATVPIVFGQVSDPVGGGLVASLARPGGNATGFLSMEYGMSTKWLELLKQMAPRVARAAVIRDPTTVGGGGQLGAIQGVAPSFGVEVSPIDARDAGGIERAVVRIRARVEWRPDRDDEQVGEAPSRADHQLAARHRLPAVYPMRYLRHRRRPDLLWV